MEDYDAVAKDKNIVWHGFMNADDFIKQVRGNFGLVWDGDSLEECHGDFGSYLKYNTPHKASFYLRARLPIIVWKESAIAPLVEEKGVGFAINSLKELPGSPASSSEAESAGTLAKTKQMAIAINNGENLKKAIQECSIV